MADTTTETVDAGTAAPETVLSTTTTGEGGAAAPKTDTKDAGVLGDTSDGKSTEGEGGEQGKDTGGSEDGKPPVDAELEIKLPEGVEFDKAVMDEFTAAAKDAGLNSEQASKIAAWELERQGKLHTEQVDSWSKQGADWLAEAKADKETGGDKFPETVLNAKKAMIAYGGDELAATFRELGIGNHPRLINAFAAIGKAMGEDSSAGGGSKQGDKPSAGDALRQQYPTMYDDKGQLKP